MEDPDTKFAPPVLEILQSWLKDAENSNKVLKLYCGVDIGGTNCRVALVNANSKSVIGEDGYLQLCKFKCNSTKDLISKLSYVGKQLHEVVKVVPVSACLDAAGPIAKQGTEVTVTNYTNDKILRISDLPNSLFSANTIIINDLAATCEGINSLSEEGRLPEFFDALWTSDNQKIQMKPVNYLVMAMGTGLGCALLVSSGNHHQVLPLENGHTSITSLGPSDPDYKEELELFQFLSNKIYQGNHIIEWEDICSGRGLAYCYEFVTRNDKDAEKGLVAMDISKKATTDTPDPNAQKALLLHYKYLFRIGAQQCVGLIGKGIFLAGDNQVANDPFVSKHTEAFKKEFLNHSKRSWIEGVEVYRQIKSSNLNLKGCLFVAKRNGSI